MRPFFISTSIVEVSKNQRSLELTVQKCNDLEQYNRWKAFITVNSCNSISEISFRYSIIEFDTFISDKKFKGIKMSVNTAALF